MWATSGCLSSATCGELVEPSRWGTLHAQAGGRQAWRVLPRKNIFGTFIYLVLSALFKSFPYLVNSLCKASRPNSLFRRFIVSIQTTALRLEKNVREAPFFAFVSIYFFHFQKCAIEMKRLINVANSDHCV